MSSDKDLARLAEGLAEIALGSSHNGTPSKAVTKALRVLLNTIAQLDERVAALEQRPELRHVGIWREGKMYRECNLVSHAGSMWIARHDTGERPGQSDRWQLVVKAGSAGNGHDRDADARKRISTAVR